MTRTRKILVLDRGQEIAEAAVVLPLFMMLLLGIYWFGRAYNIYATITHAAREGARTGTASTCATCGNAATTPNQVADQVGSVLQAAHLDPSKATPITPSFNDCGTGTTPVACGTVSAGKPQVCVQQNVRLNGNTTDPPACGIAVSFQYPYQFWLPFTSLNKQLIQLKALAQMTGEN